VATSIQESIQPLQASVNGLRDEISSFQGRLVAAEILTSENFQRICDAEATIKSLQAQNATLLDHLENRFHRANLRILNLPEGSEDGHHPTIFISKLLKDVMGDNVFPSPPKLDRAHRTAGPKPAAGRSPWPIILCFHQYQEKDTALRWSRQHEVKYKDITLRIYPDLSTALAKKRLAFNSVKPCRSACSFQPDSESLLMEKITFLRKQKRPKSFTIAVLLSNYLATGSL